MKLTASSSSSATLFSLLLLAASRWSLPTPIPGQEQMLIDGLEHLSLGAHEATSAVHDLLPVAMHIDHEAAAPAMSRVVKEQDMIESIITPPKKSKFAPPPSQSIMRPSLMEHDGISQGQVGSCHIFSTQALMKDATGVSVSVARLFLDHLLNLGGSNPIVDASKPAQSIATLNTDHVLEERTKTAADHCKGGGFFNWEAGWVEKDLASLQRIGGVIVPDNTDYNEVETIMRKLDKERLTLIKADTPFLRSHKDKLSQAGLSELVSKALSDSHQGRNIAGDRQLVQTLAQQFTVQSVDFHASKRATEENIRKRVNELVKRLESNAIVIAVDTDKYWPVVYDKKSLSVKKGDLFPTDSQHVVVLAGYEISDDTFFVRDSNFKKAIAVKARDIVLSTEWAGFYSKVRP